jgi:hypothetical protein
MDADAGPHPFDPPHCPNPECDFHLDPEGWRFTPAGTHERKSAPQIVPRFRCLDCRRSFSSQTFSVTYWLKRPDLLEPIMAGEVNGAGHRQLARQLGTCHATVQHLIERLGRYCLLAHDMDRAAAREALAQEPIVLDGLRTFARGQYWVVEISSVIGQRSTYSHDFVVTERRRSGQVTDAQREKRQRVEKEYGPPDPAGLAKDTAEVLGAVLPSTSGTAVSLYSDDEPAYVRAVSELDDGAIEHQTTPSTAPRTFRNPLFAINAHHMFMRHSGANLKRKTIAFSKRIQGLIYRHAVFQLWVNHVKSAAERDPKQSRAQRLGVARRKLAIKDLLSQRLFPSRMKLRGRVSDYYYSRVRSRFMANERGHDLTFAF